MSREFRVAADLRPGRVRVSWLERAPLATRPSFRLVRRRYGFPASVTDGFLVVDSDELFQPPALAMAWERIERVVCVAGNSVAEGGLLQGMLEAFYGTSGPARAVVSMYDATTETLERAVFAEASRITTGLGPATPPFTEVQRWEIFEKPGGGAEVSRGAVTFYESATDDTPNWMHWAPTIGPARDVAYSERRYEVTTTPDPGRLFTTFVASAAPSRQLSIRSKAIPEAGLAEWTFTVDDGDLESGVVYYYRVFGAGGAPVDEPDRGSALATGVFGAHDTMYRLLPPVHQVQDIDPTKVDGGRALYRFLQAFGRGVDHFRGLVEGIASRHDVGSARADFLPHLARMIGWIPDLTAPENTQRQDIRFAPEIFGALGTVPGTPALVNRVTTWPCKVKEFAHNVLLTNAPEFVPIWEIWQVTRRPGGLWSTPAALSLTASMDGAAVALQGAATTWVIWHSDRSGRRELWFQRLGTDAGPRRAMELAADDAPNLTYSDEAPAAVVDGTDVRLFWTSDRGGSRDIWTRLMTPAPGMAQRLTDHPKDDRHPAVVADGTDSWLFWDSDRRGPWDIWYSRRSGTVWAPPQRMAKPEQYDRAHDSFPAVLKVGADLWLFWCRDVGDRREIWHQVISGGDFGDPSVKQQRVSKGLTSGGRDEAPWPVEVEGRVWLLFHSNRRGPWQIWTTSHTGTTWEEPMRLSDEQTADKEPTGFVDATTNELRVFWTSQRRTRWYQSRVLDLNDTHMLGEIGTFKDHGHYVYDTGRTNDDWYSRDVVGLFVEPDTVHEPTIEAGVQRAAAFLDPFRPAFVRHVWPLGDLAHEEAVEVGGLTVETWTDNP